MYNEAWSTALGQAQQEQHGFRRSSWVVTTAPARVVRDRFDDGSFHSTIPAGVFVPIRGEKRKKARSVLTKRGPQAVDTGILTAECLARDDLS